jgi:hypothetical protein
MSLLSSNIMYSEIQRAGSCYYKNTFTFCSYNIITGVCICVRARVGTYVFFTHFFYFSFPFFVYEFIVSKLNILVRTHVKNFRHFDNPRTLPRLSFVIKLNIFPVPLPPPIYVYISRCFSLCTLMFRNFEIPTQNLKKKFSGNSDKGPGENLITPRRAQTKRILF